MQRFVAGEVDILVSTMIVESGLDVPNANTMVVHDAHRFGLAQLYQLRGRVGRSHRRAYCYLLVPDHDRSRRRGAAQGAGAPHRAGRGLPDRAQGPGAPRRGQPARRGAVGARPGGGVRPLPALAGGDGARAPGAGRRSSSPRRPTWCSTGPAHLPDAYVPDDDAKLDLYRRLARAASSGDIDGLRERTARAVRAACRAEAETLLDMARLRVLGARARACSTSWSAATRPA